MGPHRSNRGRAASASRARLSKYHSYLEKKAREKPEQNDELTYDNFKKALKMINCYYRHISGRDECIAFHIKYIQPIEEFIKQHQTTKQPSTPSEPEDELRERKTSNTGRGHGNNFCPENCD